MLDTIIAVDISGRHFEDDQYFMVCAAVALSHSEGTVRGIKGIYIIPYSSSKPPEITDVVRMIEETAEGTGFEGVVVAERGDMFNQPENVVKQMFRLDFKYPESMIEMMGIEFAHHVSLSSRNLILKQEVRQK